MDINIVNWLFVVVLFILTLVFIGLATMLFVLANTGLGITFGILFIVAALGSLIGGIYLTKYILNTKSIESIHPAN